MGETCRITLDYRAIKDITDYYNTTVPFLLTAGKRRIEIKKDTTNIFLGLLTDFNISKDNKNTMKMDIAAVDFFTLFVKRRTGAKRVFTNVDAGLIAWTLIKESQLSDPPYSDFGVTLGTIQTSVNRTITYRFAEIRKEIAGLSNNSVLNGFDFDIDNTGVFNVFYPQKGANRPNIVFDEANIIAWAVRNPLILSLTNKVYTVGSGFNDDVIYSTRNSLNDYKQTFGLLEDVISNRNISDTGLLDAEGDKFLRENQAPIQGITITHRDEQPDLLDYEVGDSVRVYLNEIALINVFKRIYHRSITIDENSAIIVQNEVK